MRCSVACPLFCTKPIARALSRYMRGAQSVMLACRQMIMKLWGESVLIIYAIVPELLDAHYRALAGEMQNLQTRLASSIFEMWIVPSSGMTSDSGRLIGVALDMTERQALQEQIITAQQAALRELSTPLLPIAEGVVVLPLIGSIDTRRAQEVTEALLDGVATYNAHTAIMDITGVQMVDTQVANSFIQAAQAVRLLGAQVMLTGIQPQIAQTLVQLGVDLGTIQTRSTLQAGIATVLREKLLVL
ncbi:MAG: STAS domain-containing protein [Chloroflexaceae bacterium]|nr:STAS domain-containing protein [Chloroflexaceae bacterium]